MEYLVINNTMQDIGIYVETPGVEKIRLPTYFVDKDGNPQPVYISEASSRFDRLVQIPGKYAEAEGLNRVSVDAQRLSDAYEQCASLRRLVASNKLTVAGTLPLPKGKK